MKHLRAWLGAWVALWWLWVLLAGEWNRYEWIAAACAATIAATLGEIARTRANAQVRLPLPLLRRGWNAFPQVFVDFGIITWALVRSALRREIVRGTFRAHEFPAGAGDATSVGRRTWITVLADYSPNAYVVDIDCERQLVLCHDLIPNRRSEEHA